MIRQKLQPLSQLTYTPEITITRSIKMSAKKIGYITYVTF